jgi:anti-anti-sigma regulatory factor
MSRKAEVLTYFEAQQRGSVRLIRILTRASNLFPLRGIAEYFPDDRTQRFIDELMSLAEGSSGPVVLDLSGWDEFPNSDGNALLYQLHKRLTAHGQRLAICASRETLKFFEITKLNRLFACAPDIESAITAVSAASA